jgi:hypothetical protein
MPGAIVVKQIKPARLNSPAMQAALMDQMRVVGRAIQASFEGTTENWEHDVTFELTMDLSGPGPLVIV